MDLGKAIRANGQSLALVAGLTSFIGWKFGSLAVISFFLLYLGIGSALVWGEWRNYRSDCRTVEQQGGDQFNLVYAVEVILGWPGPFFFPLAVGIALISPLACR